MGSSPIISSRFWLCRGGNYMNNVQLTLTVMLPTLAAICGFVTALVGIYVNSGRFNSIDTRLSKLESEMSGLGQRISHLEGSLGDR